MNNFNFSLSWLTLARTAALALRQKSRKKTILYFYSYLQKRYRGTIIKNSTKVKHQLDISANTITKKLFKKKTGGRYRQNTDDTEEEEGIPTRQDSVLPSMGGSQH